MNAAARYDVCIVSPGCVATGPRVEKEADALSAAGLRVAVVVCHWMEWLPEWDARIAAGRPWRLYALDWLPRSRRRTVRGIASISAYRLAREICLAGVPALPPLAALACADRVAPLAALAARVPAGLYIAHNLAGLPAAMLAARLHRAKLAFDAEDDHLGELPAVEQRGGEGRVVDAVLRTGLGACAYVTAASDGIAQALEGRYGVTRPATVLNVFPLALRERLDGLRKDRRSDALSLCWYSQTIGLDRGLQDAITALGRVRGECELHLRGRLAPDVEAVLRALAREHGVESRLFFHPQAHPDELLSRVAEHDVGLALEQDANDNRLIAVTNKILFYMLAGIAIVATDTPGQRGIAAQSGEAIDLYPQGNAAALAAHLQRFVDDRAHLERRKRQALDLAMRRFNWETEQRTVQHLAARALRDTAS